MSTISSIDFGLGEDEWRGGPEHAAIEEASHHVTSVSLDAYAGCRVEVVPQRLPCRRIEEVEPSSQASPPMTAEPAFAFHQLGQSGEKVDSQTDRVGDHFIVGGAVVDAEVPCRRDLILIWHWHIEAVVAYSGKCVSPATMEFAPC